MGWRFLPNIEALNNGSHLNYLKYCSREGIEPLCRGTVKSDVFAEGLTFGYILLGGKHVYGDSEMGIGKNIIENNRVNLKRKFV